MAPVRDSISRHKMFPRFPEYMWPSIRRKNRELRESHPNEIYVDAEGKAVIPMQHEEMSDDSLTSRLFRASSMPPAPPKDSEEVSPFLNPAGALVRYLRKKLVEEPDAEAAAARNNLPPGTGMGAGAAAAVPADRTPRTPRLDRVIPGSGTGTRDRLDNYDAEGNPRPVYNYMPPGSYESTGNRGRGAARARMGNRMVPGGGRPGLHPAAFRATMGIGNSPDLIEHQRY